MRLSWRDYLRLARGLPPTEVLRRARRLLGRAAATRRAQARDRLRCSYPATPSTDLLRYLTAPPSSSLRAHAPAIAWLSDNVLAHRFDLLGSGPCVVDIGSADGRRRPSQGKVNAANQAAAAAIAGQISPDYRPIDWQRDARSGYRWSARTWHGEVRYGHLPGVEVKWPWELARMQHLPWLAWAWALAQEGCAGFQPAPRYLTEFCDQIADFLAANPPRWGVNWVCPMDVAIRIANCLLAYDLFRALGACFSVDFQQLLAQAVLSHGRHLANHLEWAPRVRGNHYLANVAGLLYCGAYLPPGAESDAWLGFALGQLQQEIVHQFHADGCNGEASVAYHRLSAEMVVHAAALAAAVPGQRIAAASDLARFHHGPGPLPADRPAPISPWQWPASLTARLAGMARPSLWLSRPDGGVAQFGDDDSGRWCNLLPAIEVSPEGARQIDCANHQHLVEAVAALCGQMPARPCHPDAWLIAALLEGRSLAPPLASLPGQAVQPLQGLGLVVRQPGLWLALRCGEVGQHGQGGHSHNDQLAFECALGGITLIADPGTAIYTPMPELRNRMRSVAAHSVLQCDGKEPSHWLPGLAGLFSLSQAVEGKLLDLGSDYLIASHSGFDLPYRRRLAWGPDGLSGEEYCQAPRPRLRFTLHPDVTAELVSGGCRLRRSGLVALLELDTGILTLEAGLYSPAYGRWQATTVICADQLPAQFCWRLRVEEGSHG